MNSEVWINGQFLGRRPYGFIGFRYDLTEFLKTDGAPNVLAVRVDDSPNLRCAGMPVPESTGTCG